MEKETEFLMVNAATKALDYKKKNPEALEEEIIKYVLNTLDVKPELKIIGVASANEALKIQKMTKNLYRLEFLCKLVQKYYKDLILLFCVETVFALLFGFRNLVHFSFFVQCIFL